MKVISNLAILVLWKKEKKNIPNKLESTERELYVRNGDIKNTPRHEVPLQEREVPRSWGQEMPMPTKKKKKHLMYSKSFRALFFVAIVFFIGSLIFAFLNFYQGSGTVSNNNIDIVVLGNSFVDGGEALPLQIKVANRNRTSIEIADMLVEYSKGVGGENDIERTRVSLGEIGSGDIAEDIVEVRLFGEQGTKRDIAFTLEYRINNSNAIFVKEYTYQVTIATSPVDVIVSAPETVISNQEFTTEITVIQNSTEVADNMMVVANYPSGFDFKSATPSPDFGDDTWFLGDLAPGVEKTITVRGSIKASNGEDRIITVVSGSQNEEDEQEIGVQFTATPVQITIGAPFISVGLSDGQGSVQNNEFSISSTGESSFYVNWENELENSLNNVEIRANFSGSGFDPNRVTVNQGFFDTNQKMIVWNGTNNNSLASIAPGQAGQLYFSLTPKAGIPNPTIQVHFDAKGVVVGQSGIEEVKNISSATLRVASDVGISNTLYFKNGPFNNEGPLPPAVGKETTYTVEWIVSSSTSTLEGVRLSADLPSYVSWKNETFAPDQDISYSNINRRVTWNAGTITPGVDGQKKVYFKVGFTPSASQINSAPGIVSGGNLSATDSFTGETVSRTFGQITTSLFRDTGYNQAHDRVIE